MKEYRIFYFILCFISFVTVFAYQGGLTLVIFITMLLLPLVSFLFLLLSCSMVRVQVKCDENVLRKREYGTLKIEVSNKFLFPVHDLRLYGLFIDVGELKPEKKALLLEVRALGNISFDLPFCFRYRGQYRVGADFFELRDLLGLWTLKRQVDKVFDVIVIPRDLNVLENKEVNEDDTSTASRAMGGFNNSVFSSLREYKSGDTLKQIHWKLSAKQDELISKELEQPLNHSAVVFADFNVGYRDEQTFLSITDAIIETMLSINKLIITENNSVKNFWQDTEKCESLDVADVVNYSRLLYTLSLLPPGGGSSLFSELLHLFLKEAAQEKSVYFILPKITESFIELYKHIGFLSRKNVTLITFAPHKESNSSGSRYGFDSLVDDEHYEYMRDKSGAKVILLEPEELSVMKGKWSHEG
ncbi:MAG: DUF58 domain-containing protein [Oscillospiraceae bacterium]|nr:DUF58 domain-containing protein [Oscillospiraceae bacterium]